MEPIHQNAIKSNFNDFSRYTTCDGTRLTPYARKSHLLAVPYHHARNSLAANTDESKFPTATDLDLFRGINVCCWP